MSYKLVNTINTKGFGSGRPIFADVNGDGRIELILGQAWPMNREIACITVVDLDGNILWQHGSPVERGEMTYSMIPVQAADWDGDGNIEVLYIQQAFYKVADMWRYSTGSRIFKEIKDPWEVRADPDLASERALEYEGDAILYVLDGATGAVKRQLVIPAPADERIALGHFDGTGKLNCIVKDRYWNMWALNNDGKVLWHAKDSDLGEGLAFGHEVAVGDIDGDGLDEVFSTNTMFDSDGRILWQIPGTLGHHDSAFILEDLPEPHVAMCGDKVRLINSKGEVQWEKDGGHWQIMAVGQFSTDPKHGPYQFVARDDMPSAPNYTAGAESVNLQQFKGYRATAFDWYGNPIWVSNPDHRFGILAVRWQGDRDFLLVQYPEEALLQDLSGQVIDRFPIPAHPGGWRTHALDICHDSRDELLLSNNDAFYIYTNTAANSLPQL